MARDLGRLAGLDHPARDVLLLLLELRDHAVGVGDEVLDDLVLVAEDLEHLARLAQAGMGALEDLLEVLRAAGEAGAELGEDQPEALAVGTAHDVAEEVLRHDRRGLLDRHAAAVLQLLGRRARLAVDVVLADQRLRADAALGVGAEGVEARLGDLDLDERLRAARPSGASTLNSVVCPARTLPTLRSPPSTRPNELSNSIQYDLPFEPSPSDAPVASTRRRAGAGDDEDCERAPHSFGSVARSSSRQSSSSCSSSLKTFEPSGAGRLGGARAALVLVDLHELLEDLAAGLEQRPDQRRRARRGEHVDVGLRARDAGRGVGGAGRREVVEPAEQVGRVRAAEAR